MRICRSVPRRRKHSGWLSFASGASISAIVLLVLLNHLQLSVSYAFSTSLRSATLASTNANTKHRGERSCDVAIVGAGPAGLVLAHALVDRGYSVQVMEARSSFRPVGSAVFLHPFALKSVRSISAQVEQQVIDAATQIGTMSMRSITNPDKNVMVFDDFDAAPAKLGAPFITIRFWDLLQALKQGLPEDVFFFGRNVQRYEQLEDGGVRLHYTNIANDDDDDDDSTSYYTTAGMVIDAGGIRSNIRRQLVPDKKSIPRCRAYMTVLPSQKVGKIMEDNSPMIPRELGFQQGGAVAMTLARLNDGAVWWTYTDVNEDITMPPKDRDELLAALTMEFPSFVPQLIQATDPSDIVATTAADFPVTWKWGEGNVTMLGDAAHAQMPSLGLGCSTAFADIEELCRQIDKFGLTPKALRWYETVRKPQTAILQLFSRMSYFSAGLIGKQE